MQDERAEDRRIESLVLGSGNPSAVVREGIQEPCESQITS